MSDGAQHDVNTVARLTMAETKVKDVEAILERLTVAKDALQREKDQEAAKARMFQSELEVEWYIKLFLGVHFADNLA
jgi:hypothetical protein